MRGAPATSLEALRGEGSGGDGSGAQVAERFEARRQRSSHLSQHGCVIAVPARDGTLQLELDGTSLGVQRVVSGELLDTEDERQVVDAGVVLARLHLALADQAPCGALGEAGDGEQLVHGDYRSANLLWDGTRTSAVLDLEEARYDRPVRELARSAVLLATRYRDWSPTDERVRGRLRQGYESVRPLTAAEDAQWERLLEEEQARVFGG